MRTPYTRRVVPNATAGKDPMKSFKTLTELEEALTALFKQPKAIPGFDRDSMLYQQGKVDLAEQIAADKSHYAARPDAATLVCFIYDPEGRVGNPRGLEADLTTAEPRYRVEVLVAPK